MFHPVGTQSSSVYWRRRLLLAAALVLAIVLIALTLRAAADSGGATAAKRPAPARPTPAAATSSSSSPPAASTGTGAATGSAASTPQSTAGGQKAPAGSTDSTAAQRCALTNLQVAAVVGSSTYKVGDKPVVELQVTNEGASPCVQDLADQQIELRVYNGSSRVWGSHDCAIQPGTNLRTLAVGQPYRSAIVWEGLTSNPGCTGTRQRVGAGSYTLYALLDGKMGTAAQFTIS